MIIVYTGGGKGKTSAALGLALRAAGYKRKIGIIQFIKGSWFTGEMRSIPRLAPHVELIRSGKGFVGILDDKLPRSEHKKQAVETMRLARNLLKSGNYDILILDEINYAVQLRLIKVSEILNLIKAKPERTTLVLTGNYAAASVIRAADLVTEMRQIKHPYQKGIPALRGIDF